MGARRWTFYAVVAAIVLFIMLLGGGARLYTDWLWFQSLGYSNVFVTILLSDLGLRVAVGLLFFAFIFVNLLLTRRVVLEQGHITLQQENVIQLQDIPWKQILNNRIITLFFLAVSAVLAYMFSLSAAGDWVLLQKFLNPSSFGIADPIFGKDVGFYVFTLPFHIFLFNILFWSGIVTVLFVGIAYFISNPFQGLRGLLANSHVRTHLSGLLAFILLVKAWGYLLQQYLLLYSPRGVVFGPGYTDINGTLLAYRVLLILAVLAALVVIANIFLRRTGVLAYAVGGLIVVSLVLGLVYPALLQRFVVGPNELAREAPFIEHSIAFTRKAYNLDQVDRKAFPAGRTVDLDAIQANSETTSNIRLWDREPLQASYGQLQQIRTYYELKHIDVDRYTINGVYRQVMLAARELDQSRLPEQAKTWVNQRLIYTHGYGVAMSPVNEVTREGQPVFLLKDIPPKTDTDIHLERPEIYFGEATDNYVIVNTDQLEFNYPEGETNVHTTHAAADSGVTLGSILKRLVFAVALADYKIMLSTDVRPDSRILYYRNIRERVPKLAPFLMFDQDPYIVVNNGKLYWLWDAYTTTNMFPYAEPFQGRNNYIRNAVKVVVDAYTGDVDFYVAEPEDPLIRSFALIFPDMFKEIDEMPASLRAHIRYPVDLFKVQAEMYATYHMQNAAVFYNREDKWSLPTEIFGQEKRPVEPYYTIVRLPGEEAPEFVLIMPFTPHGRENMIGWMAARSDGEHYGNLLVYEMPKQSLVYGPMQVEARINQDQYISQQLTLWENRGTRVIRGNLLSIPIEDSLLYIEPIYLQAEDGRMPELRRVVLLHGERVVFEPDLPRALAAMFGTPGAPGAAPPPVTDPDAGPLDEVPVVRTMADLIEEANREYERAQERLREGDWSGYGAAISNLGRVLDELLKQAGQETQEVGSGRPYVFR